MANTIPKNIRLPSQGGGFGSLFYLQEKKEDFQNNLDNPLFTLDFFALPCYTRLVFLIKF